MYSVLTEPGQKIARIGLLVVCTQVNLSRESELLEDCYKKLIKECLVLNTNFTSFNITLVNINVRGKTGNTVLHNLYESSLGEFAR